VIFGRLIGAVAGVLSGFGIIGAIIGYLIGRYFDRSLAGMTGFAPDKGSLGNVQTVFFETCFQLLGHIAKADGRVSESEIDHAEHLISQMGLTPQHRQQAIHLFKQGSSTDFDFNAAMQRFSQTCGRYQVLRTTFIQFVISMALADDEVHPAEERILRDCARYLGITEQQFQQFMNMATGQQHFHNNPNQGSLDDAYTAMGLTSSCSDAELKRAYRKLMSQNHPDKLIAKGVPEDMIKLATEKSQDIQNAYERIKKERGLR
jgi:DnaJ like chaperone protein